MNLRSLLHHPYVLVVLLVLAVVDIGGIIHASREHGPRATAIAIILPPYGLYRAVESLGHARTLTDEDVAKLMQSDAGRRSLAGEIQLKPEVWEALINLVTVQKNHEIRTTMVEGGVPYDVTANVPAEQPVTLTIQAQSTPELVITMIDEDRDQTPDTLRIVKQVDGKPEVHVTPLKKYSDDDASQFLLAWSLAWGTIAEEQKARVQPPAMNGDVNGVPVGSATTQ